MEKGQVIIAENLELDFSVGPVGCAAASNVPAHNLIGLVRGHFNHRCAKPAEPELQGFANRGFSAPIDGPPMGKLVHIGYCLEKFARRSTIGP